MTTTSRWFQSVVVALSLASLTAMSFAGHALAKPCDCEHCECCAASLCYSEGYCLNNQQCTCSGWVQSCG